MKDYGNRECPNCKDTFIVTAFNQVYCTRSCSKQYHKNRYGIVNRTDLPANTVGALHELIVTADLLSKGYYVFRSVTPNSPCDLIIQRGNLVLRVEVKTRRLLVNGTYIKPPMKNANPNQFDAIAFVDGSTVQYSIDL